ncbi:winged helix-turn-helix domain-containing protein [Defluviimonas sp. WL0024]|uniref:Winged helix-turn-helix domain-containing protein n=1 Tax=Albidovulum salinarum TaxID=2984153 RepID=A0ABT2X543_9RHOB|nr:winged helix-turn-helix domain-containing protein [Defluviimonas sp. WL0024]MCU9849060.1 winged helix-turn-helix domain-containing protein [Defluviimonas sp. WL0024]
MPLRSQSAEVLAFLAGQPGEVISKEALIAAVWPDTFVTDDSLVQCIADIRRALDDSDHRLVQTLPKKGYRLIAEPAAAAAADLRIPRVLPPPPWRAVAVMTLVLLAVIAWQVTGRASTKVAVAGDAPTIAVLAFDDFSAGADRGFLSDAIAEGIITELARSHTYGVIARNSSFRYREAPADIRRIANELGVDYVLEGSQQKDGDRLKVTAQLIDAANGRHIWSNSYNREIGDLFTVQDEIIRTLADRVGQRIERPVPGRDPAGVSALHYLLQGIQTVRSDFSAESNATLRRLATRAVGVDPDAPYGHIGLAWAERHDAVFGWNGADRHAALERGLRHAERAIDLAPDNAETHYARARILSELMRHDEAAASFDKAIELNPSDSDVLVGSTDALLYVGRTDEAIARIERAKGIDPFHKDWFHWQMGWALWEKGDCDGALAAMRKMRKIFKGAHRMLAGIHACLGEDEKAQAAYRVFYADSAEPTIAEQRAEWQDVWTAPGSLDRWLEHMRIAGMRD